METLEYIFQGIGIWWSEGWLKQLVIIVASLFAFAVASVIIMLACVAIGRVGFYVGIFVAVMGAIALMLSAMGFLIFDDVEFSFKKPLIAIGVGLGIIIFSPLIGAWAESEVKKWK